MEDGVEGVFFKPLVPHAQSNDDVTIVKDVYSAPPNQRNADEDRAINSHLYGDLDKQYWPTRALQETCFTTNKEHLDQHFSEPLNGPAEESKKEDGNKGQQDSNHIIVGINSTRAFAIQGNVAQYKNALRSFELASVVKHLRHEVAHVNTLADAKSLLKLMVAQVKADPSLKPAVDKVSKTLSKKMRTLTDKTLSSDVPVAPGRETVPAFDVLQVAVVPDEEGAEDGEYELYTVHDCLVNKPGAQWRAWTRPPLRVKKDTLPSVSVNDTHLVAVYQPPGMHNEDALVVDYLLLTDGPGTGRRTKRVAFTFPTVEHGHGLLLSDVGQDGTVAVVFGNVVVIIPPVGGNDTEQGAAPFAYVLSDKSRTITACRVDVARVLVLGTNLGDCLGINLGTNECTFHFTSPAAEPVFNATHSNRRTVFTTSLALDGLMVPYVPTPTLVHQATARLLSIATCGTLVFTLEKHTGIIGCMSMELRNVLFPFDPHHYDGDSLHAYTRSIYAGPEYVAVVYPDGTIRTLAIKDKIKRSIEKRVKK